MLTEPYIRIGVLNNLASLLDRNSEFSVDGQDTITENEERLFDVPIMMLTDINQQVSTCAVRTQELFSIVIIM